jgi:hypothetical protein
MNKVKSVDLNVAMVRVPQTEYYTTIIERLRFYKSNKNPDTFKIIIIKWETKFHTHTKQQVRYSFVQSFTL